MSTLVATPKTSSFGLSKESFLTVPPNFFAIPMGLAGLAGVWRVAGNIYGWPGMVANIVYALAGTVFVLLLACLVAKLIFRLAVILADLKHPVLGPFNALFPISGMLLSGGLQPFASELACGLFVIFFLLTLGLGGWLTGQWMLGELQLEKFHPGYFLPTVAGGLVGADGAAHFGLVGLGWLSFGMGIVCWLTLGSIILNRLFFQKALPATILPTMAIELAPPVVGGTAYLDLSGQFNTFTYALAGFALLLFLVQLRLLPLYIKLKFDMGWWSFTFTFAAASAYILRWINHVGSEWSSELTYVMLAVISLLIGMIVLRSLGLLWHSLFKKTVLA
jgi:tellurite resistance protein